MAPSPTASIVIPTRDRPGYLEVTLASVMPQARRASAEVLVVAPPRDTRSAAVARRFGARLVAAPGTGRANAARNAGIEASRASPIVLIDDDVQAPEGWLRALLAAVEAGPEYDVFGGPIRARLEGGGPRACGREPAPITTLDLGDSDRDAELVWSANMAIRRSALRRVGPFDEGLQGRGEEEDWQRRHLAAGGRTRYVAAAGLEHRRTRADSTLRALARSAYGHGRGSRRYDERKGHAPSPAAELRTLAGCVWHAGRRRCAIGIVLTAHSAGRLRELLAGRP